jgi:hypothetical protein
MTHQRKSEESRRLDRPLLLNPTEPYLGFGLIRRSPTATAHWFQRHWLALMLPVQVGLTGVFVFFAARYGLTGSTILFGLLAAYNLVALLTRWLFADYWWIRQRGESSCHSVPLPETD